MRPNQQEQKHFGDDSAIWQYVFNRRDTTQLDFDSQHRKGIDTVLIDIGRIYSVLGLTVVHGVKLSDSKYDGFSLLTTALESIISSLHLTRQGARIDAFALLRIAVESASVSIHITHDSEAYQQYTGQHGLKYDAKRAISYTKKLILQLGEFWGALSQVAVHPNARAFGPRRLVNGSMQITVGKVEVSLEQEKAALVITSVAALIVFRATELVLFEHDKDHTNWINFCGTEWQVNELANRLLEERYRQLLEIPGWGIADVKGRKK